MEERFGRPRMSPVTSACRWHALLMAVPGQGTTSARRVDAGRVPDRADEGAGLTMPTA